MSETIDSGAELTAAEIKRRLSAIKANLTAKAWVQTSIDPDGPAAVSLSCYPYGVLDSTGRQRFEGATFGVVLAAAEAWSSTFEPIRHDAIIRKLALDIIDLTDQHGECTMAMLRGRKHQQEDIDAYKDAACARAGEMSGNAPFSVIAP